MRIVVDLQPCQTSRQIRGIGRYAFNLVQSMARHAGNHEIWLLLNGLYLETLVPIREAFCALLPEERIRVWNAPGPVAPCIARNAWQQKAGEILRAHALEEIQPDIVFITSLFEEIYEGAITTPPPSFALPHATILYDLIPMIYSEHYLYNQNIRLAYYKRAQSLRNYEIIFAISEATKQDAINLLGIPSQRIVTLSAGVEKQFRANAYSLDIIATVHRRYGLSRPFVMYVGGEDYRKNIEGLIRAYSLLPLTLRAKYQLALTFSISDVELNNLKKFARTIGLGKDEVVFTGFVSEEDLIILYNTCALFAFPSMYEGFGLPVLEAMACGAPVIAANSSSLPEVVGNKEALFDPHNPSAIAATMVHALTDEGFRARLRENSVERTKHFSWDTSAQLTLKSLEAWHEQKNISAPIMPCRHKPKLAYVSPLPPERSGIAEYSAELIPELAKYYDIELIVNQEAVDDEWLSSNFPIRNWRWFDANAFNYARILYHIGNSTYHTYMFTLLLKHPGIVVLHDFSLSDVLAHLERKKELPDIWTRALYYSHGYCALHERKNSNAINDIIEKYPANIDVIKRADGIIVHTQQTLHLARKWYRENITREWAHIPLLRKVPVSINCSIARKLLGFNQNDFLVCSFGYVSIRKLHHHISEAWQRTSLAHNSFCYLVFVGGLPHGEEGADLLRTIGYRSFDRRIKVTDFVDNSTYTTYLAATNIAVQLRSASGREASRAILDCMAHEIPVITNIDEFPDDTVYKLPEEFTLDDLIQALNELKANDALRKTIGQRGREYIAMQRHPTRIALKYRDAIERFASTGYFMRSRKTIASLAAIESHVSPTEEDLIRTALALADSRPPVTQRQLLVDVTPIAAHDLKTGIQRVVRTITHEFLQKTGEYRVEPVIIQEGTMYYARHFTCSLMDLPMMKDEGVELYPGDVFLSFDLHFKDIINNQAMWTHLRMKGVALFFCVYDLVPAHLPGYFSYMHAPEYLRWLRYMCTIADGAVCISRTVANELFNWLDVHKPVRTKPLNIGYFHLGANIQKFALSPSEDQTLKQLKDTIGNQQLFLMVGAVEPRKGHAQALAAFEQLWAQGIDCCLAIVGKQGWMVESLTKGMHKHPQNMKRLFWLGEVSDQALIELYKCSTALLMASEAEGFSLPLVEAAQHGLPIIARDIPVFREIAGQYAFYFKGKEAENMVEAIKEWCTLYRDEKHPCSKDIPRITWEESANQLRAVIFENKWYKNWMPSVERALESKLDNLGAGSCFFSN